MPSTAVNGEPLCIHHTTTAAQNDLSPYVSRVIHPNYPFNDTWKELARISSACQLSTVSQALNLAPLQRSEASVFRCKRKVVFDDAQHDNFQVQMLSCFQV